MVPPWVPEPSAPDAAPAVPANPSPPPDAKPEPVADPNAPQQPSNDKPPIPVMPQASAKRFKSARTFLGKFANSGNSSQMKRGVGSYVKSGYGGAGTAARRFGGTAKKAGTLYGVLSSGGGAGGGGEAITGNLLPDTALLTSKSAEEVMDAVVEAVSPVDGTQDTELLPKIRTRH